jgi:hypothetical protein
MIKMKEFIGIMLMLASIVIGLYVGVWLMFVGGIIQVIDAFQSTPIASLDVALGLLRVFCASFVGWLSFAVLFVMGKSMLD